MKLRNGFVNNPDVLVMFIIVMYIYYIYICTAIVNLLNANVMYDVSTLHYSVNQVGYIVQ